jgi:hypothetical protein
MGHPMLKVSAAKKLWSYLPNDFPRKFQWVESLPSKRRFLEKKRNKNWKAKEVKSHMKKLHVSKKKREYEIYKLLGEILSKERISHFPTVQNPMCGLVHTHTSFAFALPSIPWPGGWVIEW